MKLIDKASLVAEIIRRRKAIPKDEDDTRLQAVYGNEAFVLTQLLEYIDTLEMIEIGADLGDPKGDKSAKYIIDRQKEQMMSEAIDATIGLPYENKDGGYTHLIDVSRPLPVGNNKIAIIFKED